MDRAEYDSELKMLTSNYEYAKKKLMKNYMRENVKSHYEVNNIIRDNLGKIWVRHILYRGTVGDPMIVYSGIIFNKDGKLSKAKKIRRVFERDVIKDDIIVSIY